MKIKRVLKWAVATILLALVGWLFIAYWDSQRKGAQPHSPRNCLPGGGWEPLEASRVTIPLPPPLAPISVNRFLIQKDRDQQVVLYWYQSHDRVIASEYWSKAYMVLDAIRLNRTDAALVRVVSPVIGTGDAAEQAAEGQAADFVRAMFPLLGRYLPV